MWIEFQKEFLGKKAGERVFVNDAAEANALVGSGTAKAVHDDPLAATINKGVEAAMAGFTRGLDSIINATLKQFAQAQTLSRKNGSRILFGEDGGDTQGKSFGDWLKNVAIATTGKGDRAAAVKRINDDYGSGFSPWQKAAMGESSGATGGYVVPPDFYTDLLAVAAEEATFRQNAFVMPMASATLQMPYLDITQVMSAGQSPFFGGVIANWTAEAQTRTETEPKFKMMELKAQELSGYSVSSNILLQDAAFGLEKYLRMLFGKAVAWYEEYAFLQGNGVGKPLGVLNAPCTIKVTRALASHFGFADVANMASNLLPASINRAQWYISPTVIADLMQLKDGSNRAMFLSIDQGITKKPIWKLLNLPVNVTEKVPALGTLGDVMLVDPSLYVIGDRQQLEVAASEHVNFLSNQMTWRFVQRVDGKPWLENKITLQDGTSTISPFVVLN